jgi:adenine-specific DNA-methyltransferase
MQQNFKEHIIQLLLQDDRLNDEQGELRGNLVKEFVNTLDEKLITLLLEDEQTRTKFFLKIKDAYVFKTNEFKFFLDENSIDNSFTQYSNRIGLASGGKFLKDNTDVVLNFPFKDCILEGGQSTEDGLDTYFEDDGNGDYTEKQSKRKEIFFNEVLARDEIDRLLEPKAFTNITKYDSKGKSKPTKFNRNAKGTITDNLIIKGNNLLALHSLKKEFKGKVKLIYIDPPFNTGNDSFAYNDNFNHSTWLTFMRNRLEVGKELLSEDGLLFINVDDIEEAYLKVLCDDVFGLNNFLNVITVKSSTPSGTKTAHKEKTIIKQKDLILAYRKTPSATLNPQFTVREKWDKHYSKYLIGDSIKDYKLVSLIDILLEKKIIHNKISIAKLEMDDKAFKKFYLSNSDRICRLQSHKNKDADKQSRLKGEIIYEHIKNKVSQGLYYNGQVVTPLKKGVKKVYKNQKFINDLGMLLCDFWWDIDFQNTQNEGGVSFPTAKKPELLLSRIIELATNENDIVLDYHLGSGTTNAVSLKANRQFIGIEQLDYGKNDSVKRLQNVIGKKTAIEKKEITQPELDLVAEASSTYYKSEFDQSGVSKAYNWQGGGSFIYLELAKNNQTAKEEIQKCKSLKELMQYFETMYNKYFLHYNVRIKQFKEEISQEENFKKLPLERQKEIFAKILDLNQLYVNLSEIEDSRYNIDAKDIALSKDFYQLKK